MKFIKYFIFLLLAIPVAAIAQPSGSWPVSHGSSAPSYTPSGSGTRLYFNTATNELYTWQPAPTSSWIKYPKAFDQISGCAAPAYTPTARQSTFAVNSCTPKPELYQYTGSSWACLNCYPATLDASDIVVDNSGFNVLAGTDAQTAFEETDAALSNTLNTTTSFGGDVSGTYDNLQLSIDLPNGVDTIGSYSELRSYTGDDMAVCVQNFGTTQGGVFKRVSTGSENGATLIVASNGIKWARDFDGTTFYPEFWEVGGYDEAGLSGGISDITERIQAAINTASPVGGKVILREAFSPYNVVPKVNNITIIGGKGCVEMKNNVSLIMQQGVVLRKADGAQTDATGGVSVIYADTVSNIVISGGEINGNTAGQTGWTGGYSQAGVNGSGIFIAQNNATVSPTSSNVRIENIRVVDHFSTASEIIGIDKLTINDYYFTSTGEGLEVQRSSRVVCTNIQAYGDGVEVGDGFEFSEVNDFSCSDIIIKNWSSGTAFDFFASKRGIVNNWVITGNSGQNGIAAGTNAGGTYADNITFSDGYIFGLYTGAYTQDGSVKFSNIVFDSCSIGIQVPAGNATEIVNIDGCSFKNKSTGTGILVQSNKKVYIQGCNFDGLNDGINIVSSSTTLTPGVFIGNCQFSQMGRDGILFDAQAQGSSFSPYGLISSTSFRRITRNSINLPATKTNIRVSEITLDSVYTYTSSTNTISSNTMYVGSASPNPISTIPVGTDGQNLTFLSALPSGSSKTFNSSGNILLNGITNFTMVQRCALTLKYSATMGKWIEVSRSQAADISSTSSATLERKYFLPDWSVENVGAASQTNVFVQRFGTTTTYGRDFYMPYAGMIRQIGIISNEAITTGTVTGNLMFSGTGPVGTVSLSGGQTSNTTTYNRYAKSFNAGTRLGVSFTTDGTYAHPNADILIWMEVEY